MKQESNCTLVFTKIKEKLRNKTTNDLFKVRVVQVPNFKVT